MRMCEWQFWLRARLSVACGNPMLGRSPVTELRWLPPELLLPVHTVPTEMAFEARVAGYIPQTQFCCKCRLYRDCGLWRNVWMRLGVVDMGQDPSKQLKKDVIPKTKKKTTCCDSVPVCILHWL